MTYQEAHTALVEIKAMLDRDGQFRTAYTSAWAAIANRVAELAKQEPIRSDK